MEETAKALLGEIRQEIDAIDKQLLPLFQARMACSDRVAQVKRTAGLPILNAQREQEILDRVREEAGEFGPAAAALYASLMALSRDRQQEKMGGGLFEPLAATSVTREGARVICQGVLGAYSHRAAKRFFPGAHLAFRKDFEGVFAALEAGEGDFGVIPVENSAAGSVAEVYSLIMQYRHYIVGAVTVTVDHLLAAKTKDCVTRVISHPQALLQCADYIKAKGFAKTECSNTAAAAQFVAESDEVGLAAICAREAATQYGLTVLDENIQDQKDNKTRFAVISKKAIYAENADKISLCFSMPNQPGALYRVLERFALRGLNLTKIESRPIRGRSFEYDFYLDFAGNVRDPQVGVLLASLQTELPRFSFLGNYCEEADA